VKLRFATRARNQGRAPSNLESLVWVIVVTSALAFATTMSASAEAQPADSSAILNLAEVVRRAEQHDPGFLAAQFDEAAGREFETLGKAALRPVVQATANVGRNRQDRLIRVPGQPNVEDQRFYDSSNVNVRLIQPLVSMDNIGRYREGLARADAAETMFRDETQLFLERVIDRYLSVLAARRVLSLLERDGAELLKQQRVAVGRLEAGDSTRLEVAGVDTAVNRWKVDMIDAQGALNRALNALEVSVGELSDEERDAIFDRNEDLPRVVGAIDEWQRVAHVNSTQIAFAVTEVQLAEAGKTRAKSARVPRLDAFVSYTRNDSDTVNTVNQQFDTSSIGLQVSMPLYVGGGGSAGLRQATAEVSAAKARVGETMSALNLDVRTAFDTLHVGLQRVKALMTAEASAQVAVDAGNKAYRAGAEGLSEVLAAQRERLAVQSELTSARYEVVRAFVMLNRVAGLLDQAVVDQLSALFVRPGGSAPKAVPVAAPELAAGP